MKIPSKKCAAFLAVLFLLFVPWYLYRSYQSTFHEGSFEELHEYWQEVPKITTIEIQNKRTKDSITSSLHKTVRFHEQQVQLAIDLGIQFGIILTVFFIIFLLLVLRLAGFWFYRVSRLESTHSENAMGSIK